jgi:hypothetical protein
LAERRLPKPKVAGSTPVVRFCTIAPQTRGFVRHQLDAKAAAPPVGFISGWLRPGPSSFSATADGLAFAERREIGCCRWDERSASATAPTSEKPVLSDEERAARLERLAERLFSPDGLDRDTLERIEQQPGNE